MTDPQSHQRPDELAELRRRVDAQETYLESCRRRVEEQYASISLGSGSVGGCFGSILCHEIHHGGPDETGLHFVALANKWGIPVSTLGELVWDHCRRLEPLLVVRHEEQ